MNDNNTDKKNSQDRLLDIMNNLLRIIALLVAGIIILPLIVFYKEDVYTFFKKNDKNSDNLSLQISTETKQTTSTETFWSAANI